MSQNLAVGNSHQHSVSLVLSWNTSLLPPRPEAEQGRTPWLQDKATRRCMLARRGTVGSEHLHFVKAQSESGQVPVRPSVFQSTPAVTWPRVILLNDRSITATTCARPLFLRPVTNPQWVMDVRTKARFTSLQLHVRVWVWCLVLQYSVAVPQGLKVGREERGRGHKAGAIKKRWEWAKLWERGRAENQKPGPWSICHVR